MRISIISTLDNPMLGNYIESISSQNKLHSVILDLKGWSEKDKFLWDQRTRGKIEKVDLYNLNDKIPFYFFKSHNSEKHRKFIEINAIDLVINIGTPRILKKSVINTPKIGILNCHPGILPNYRGCSCVEWALFNNDPVGNTAHLMTKSIDEGPIISSKIIDISKIKNYEDIRIAVTLDSMSVINKAIDKLTSNTINMINYPKNGKYYKPIDDEKMNLILEKYSN